MPARTRKPPPPKPPLERDVQKAILSYLKLAGVLVWRNNAGAFSAPATATHARRFVRYGGMAGASDLIGVVPGSGKLLAIEVKRPGERPTADQVAFLRAVAAEGGVAFWADSVAVVAVVLDGIRDGARVEVDEHGDQVLVGEDDGRRTQAGRETVRGLDRHGGWGHGEVRRGGEASDDDR